MKEMIRDFVLRMTCGNESVAEICAALAENEDQGDICHKLTKSEIEVLKAAPALAANVATDVDVASVQTPFVRCGELLYTRRNWLYERCVGDAVRRMSGRGLEEEIVLPDTEFYRQLRPEQRNAVIAMCRAQFSILTGGPGTGKTHTIARAVHYLQEKFPDFRLGFAAPTGKAAARMEESMSKAGVTAGKPVTIHSLVGINPSTMDTRYKRTCPLSIDWLIVDEASMIGLPLMFRLLDALHPDCKLTLVGDADQLASVERGRVFGDLCRMRGVSFSRLSESTRFKPNEDIAKLARAINDGKASDALSILKTNGSLVTYVSMERVKPFDPATWEGFKDLVSARFQAFSESPAAADAIAHLNDFRILCAGRRGPFGANALNEWVKNLLGKKCPVPMMITQNDKTLGVANGDVGVVMPREPKLLYLPDRDKPIRLELLPETELAFASTVHKTQGSEYDDVAVVLPPDGESPLLTREILYTAITRTKGKVFLYGSDKAIENCCMHKVERLTGFC